ncbi:MAG TPA: DUF5916 domain-containing protein [bacterium]
MNILKRSMIQLFVVLFSITTFTCFGMAKEIAAPLIPAPSIDGLVELTEWQDASLDSGFVQMQPHKGLPSTEKTFVRVGMDKQNLFVAFICITKDIQTISAGNPQRDQGSENEDCVALLLDTFHDKRSGYVFHVNVLNTQTDIRIESNGESQDGNWDCVWRSATQKNEDGWSVEMAIPFKSMKFSTADKRWGINFGRAIARNQELTWWNGLIDDNFRVSQSGELTFPDRIPGERKPTVWIPYFNSYRENTKNWNGEIGLDGEIPITSDLSTNITINPDFASVEGDEEEINLDPWDIQYEEKRPFFRDVNALFDVRYNVFYSRRIGDIQHGEKFSGKIGPLQVAGVYARTNEIVDDPTTPDDNEFFPEANFAVFRVQKDILAASTLGVTYADKNYHGGYHRMISLDTKMYLPYQIKTTGQLFYATSNQSTRSKWAQTGSFIRVAREANYYHYHLRLTSLGSDLLDNVNTVGYLSYDNVIELDGELWYKHFLKNNKLFKYFYYGSNYKYDWSQDKILGRYEIQQEASIYLTNRFNFEAGYIYEYRTTNWRRAGQLHRYKKTLDLEIGYNTQEWAYAKIGLEIGETFDGPFNEFEASSRIKLFEKLGLQYSFESRKYNKQKADPVATDVNLHILELDFYLTNDLFLRLFTQHRSDDDRFYLYGQFGYRYAPPNSAIYLTYAYDKQDSSHLPINRILFLKVSHAFSL